MPLPRETILRRVAWSFAALTVGAVASIGVLASPASPMLRLWLRIAIGGIAVGSLGLMVNLAALAERELPREVVRAIAITVIVSVVLWVGWELWQLLIVL